MAEGQRARTVNSKTAVALIKAEGWMVGHKEERRTKKVEIDEEEESDRPRKFCSGKKRKRRRGPDDS